jgi:hypothetical protein
MKSFTIYPKKGEKFSLTCQRFETREKCFILYDWANKASDEGFLCFTEVAAIIPDKQTETKEPFMRTPICFLVYLKDKEEPAKVFAHSFRIEQDSGITFLRQVLDINEMVSHESPIEGIYISVSELVAIVPKDGLVRRD